MPKKKETKDITALTFFECQEIIDKVTAIAAEHDGEVPDEQIDALIEAQTQAPAKLKSMCNFTKLLDNKIDLCKKTKEDINASCISRNLKRTALTAITALWLKKIWKRRLSG